MNIKDRWPLARIVEIRWFGITANATVIGYDLPTNQIRVQFNSGNGSCYCTDEELASLNHPSEAY